MNNKKIDELKYALKSINCPQEMDNRVLTNVNKKTRVFKPAIAIISILLIGIVTVGVVNAEEFAKKISNLFMTNYSETEEGYDFNLEYSGLAEINYEANIPECEPHTCQEVYSKQELENLLGIKILSNKIYPTDKYKLLIAEKNEGKIAQLAFKLAEDITDDSQINEYKNFNKYTTYISLNTKYRENYDGTILAGGAYDYEKYHINSINEDAIIMKTPGLSIFQYRIMFAHKDIIYHFEILFGSWEQNPDDVAHNFLESLFEE